MESILILIGSVLVSHILRRFPIHIGNRSSFEEHTEHDSKKKNNNN